MTELWAALFVMLAAFMGSFGSVYFKKAANKLEFTVKALSKNYDLMKGLLIYGMSTIVYIIGIKGGELSVLFPLVSTGYIWICFLSMRYLGERMNVLKWAGIAAIVTGVTLIGLGS